ncbi:Ig-like domain-containing protein [Streptomyces boninensis]|uniref:Ig-like domain-containing protein n=1 Tax=Streptomyces boninensis TaxID=2039455 RepID=UPI003B20F355
MRRPIAVLLSLLVAVAAAAAAGTAPASVAAPADCDQPTRTLSGGSSASLTLTSGETLLLQSGSYTGGVSAFPQGAVLCVATDATFSPSYVNQPAGTLVVEGQAKLPYLSSASGFRLDNAGTVKADGLNANGTTMVVNRAGATMEFAGALALADSSQFRNAGTAVAGSLTVAPDAAVLNTGKLDLPSSGVSLYGELDNSGRITIANHLNSQPGSSTFNSCVIKVSAGWAAAGTAQNSGVITLGSDYLNNSGTLTQTTGGRIGGANFTNSGTIQGFGGYRFTGNTVNQATFSGDSASDPIAFYDTTQTSGGIFDTAGGTVTNTERAEVTVDADSSPAGCASPFTTSADLYVYKTGPAAVSTGDKVTYTVTAANLGPGPATDVTVTDTLPAGLTDVTASDGGTVSGTTVTWQAGDIAAGDAVNYEVTGTAAEAGTLHDTAAGRTTATDPDKSNNDGTASDAQVDTTVTDRVPANNPPVMADQTARTRVDHRVAGRLVASDPDTGQTLTFSLPDAPQGALLGTDARGTLTLAPNGVYLFTPAENFTGRASYTVQVCDNGTPKLCTRATLTITVSPIAANDSAGTESGTPVTIDTAANDRGEATAPTVVTPPEHGTLTQNPDGTFVYTPDADFTGTDAFTYRICSPNAPDVCAEATATILVTAANHPPEVGDRNLITREDTPVSSAVSIEDPEGDEVTARLGAEPEHGTVEVAADGTFTYTPDDGYTGTDTFTVIACDDGDPALCDTGRVTVVVRPAQPQPSPTDSPTDSPGPTDSPTDSPGPTETPTESPTSTTNPTPGPTPTATDSPGPTPLPDTGDDDTATALAVAAGLAAAGGLTVLLRRRRRARR